MCLQAPLICAQHCLALQAVHIAASFHARAHMPQSALQNQRQTPLLVKGCAASASEVPPSKAALIRKVQFRLLHNAHQSVVQDSGNQEVCSVTVSENRSVVICRELHRIGSQFVTKLQAAPILDGFVQKLFCCSRVVCQLGMIPNCQPVTFGCTCRSRYKRAAGSALTHRKLIFGSAA